jgi:photosystem II stability/assembly factor-like uncharacterized protein
MFMRKLIAAFSVTSLLTLGAHAVGPADPEILEALEWREIGPWRGGRVTTVTGVRGHPQRYYMGATGGGVWKTENGGTTWENISDGDFEVGTIGAIAVTDSDLNVLYVGTGESPIRGVTTSHGNGVYKSTDGGASWDHVGLHGAGQISRIKIHPDNPDRAWVAVQGTIWGPSEERGVFRTDDGGKSWQHVLKVNPDTGAADLAIDPTNPRVLYTAMWHHGRTPWFVKSGGEGGGIYKTVDGGDTWKQLEGGLPELVGKIGIDVSATNPDRVYAIVEAEYGKGGLYRSDDAGGSWTLINGARVLHSRAWYYNHITADPTNENTVWVQNVTLMKSMDGGDSFEKIIGPHGDYHDHWINPDDPLNMINANDGGATVTFDGGETWSSIMNQPTAQFYRVITDNQQPFRIYAGQQDNSTVSIASETVRGGITHGDYHSVGGGESAHIAFDENDPRLIYATTINGVLTEYDAEIKLVRSIIPYPEHVFGMDSKDLRYRANWNPPVITSPHDPSVIYYGTQILLRSTDRGVSWTEVSPDLTRDEEEKQGRNGGPLTPENVGAEFYNTIFAVQESRHEAGTLWVGSDDGLVHLTRNGGESWNDVTPPERLEGMVNTVEISPHDPATLYFPLARYKLNDFRPYVYKTADFGTSWQRIDSGLPADTFVRVVREDPVHPGLLYAGTEAGMFVSFDGGGGWQSLDLNLPPVPITDLTIRQDTLVAATQGRGFWVLDDLSRIYQMEPGQADQPLFLLRPADVKMARRGGDGGEFGGANPPAGAQILYHLAEAAEGELSIEIRDGADNLVRRHSSEQTPHQDCLVANMDLRSPFTLSFPGKEKGINRWSWNLREDDFPCLEEIAQWVGYDGPRVEPGIYQVTVTAGGHSQSASFELLADPRLTATAEETTAWRAAARDLGDLYREILSGLEQARKAADQISRLLADYPDDETLGAAGRSAIDRLAAWDRLIDQELHETYEDEDSWPVLLLGQVMNLHSAVESSGAPVTAGALERTADLRSQWAERRRELDAIKASDIGAFNRWARDQQVPHVVEP